MSAMIQAAFKKLGWLFEHFGQRTIKKVSFRVFTHDLLEQDCGYHAEESGRNGIFCEGHYFKPSWNHKEIKFFLKDGKMIGQVGVEDFFFPEKKRTSWKLFGGRTEVIIPAYSKEILFPETVGEALKRLDSEHNVYYIVGLLEGDLIVTKPSCGNSIHESLEAEMKKAEQEVESAIR